MKRFRLCGDCRWKGGEGRESVASAVREVGVVKATMWALVQLSRSSVPSGERLVGKPANGECRLGEDP